MKKKLLLGLLAAAAVSFTACQKNEVISEMPQDNAIGFGTYVGRDAQTKATVTDLNAMKHEDYSGFGVFAYYTGNDDYPVNNTTIAPAFMNNVKVWYDTDLNPDAWNYAPLKYWPGNGQQVSFFAYAPYVNAPDAKITTLPAADVEADPTIGFSVPTTVSAQIDLLYASVKDASSNPVNFTFNHALSRIGFKAKTARTDYKITINSVEIEGKFKKSGTLNLNSGNWDNNTVAGDETTYTLNTFVAGATDLSNTDGVAITPSDQYLMIIPTDLKTDPNQVVTVTVNYSYQYKVGDGPTNAPSDDVYAESVSVSETGTVGIDFVKGKAYTLVFTLDPLQPIQFSVNEVTGWDPEAGTDTPVTTTLP